MNRTEGADEGEKWFAHKGKSKDVEENSYRDMRRGLRGVIVGVVCYQYATRFLVQRSHRDVAGVFCHTAYSLRVNFGFGFEKRVIY